MSSERRLMPIKTSEKISAVLIRPTKFMLLFGLMSSVLLSSFNDLTLNAQFFNSHLGKKIIINHPGTNDGSKQTGSESNDQGNGKTLNRSCSKLEEEEGSNECCNIGIKNGNKCLGIAAFD